MSEAHAKSENDVLPAHKESATGAEKSPPNKDLDALSLLSSAKSESVPQSSNAGKSGLDWSTYGLFKTQTTQDDAGTATTVMVNGDDKPYDVSVTAKDGSNTHMLFGPDGNPDQIYQNGATKPDVVDFKTQDGTDYRFTELHPVIDGMHPDGQVLPRLTITSSDGLGGTVETFKDDTEKGWQTAEVEHDYANNSRDFTYYDPPGGTPYIEKVSQNPDGGYNEGFFNIHDGITPIDGMDGYRMIPDGQGGKNFTFMKSDGTIDYRESMNQSGVITSRVDAYGNPLPFKP
jgi:hypothetical protein